MNEALFTDLDGTFTENAPGCTVMHDNLLADPRAFPECYQDERYSGTVCCGCASSPTPPTCVYTPPKLRLQLASHCGRFAYYYYGRLKFVTVGFMPRDDKMTISADMHSGRVSYRPGGIYVPETDVRPSRPARPPPLRRPCHPPMRARRLGHPFRLLSPPPTARRIGHLS